MVLWVLSMIGFMVGEWKEEEDDCEVEELFGEGGGNEIG